MEIRGTLNEIEEKDKKINSFIVLDKEGISRRDIADKGRLKNLVLGIKSNINVEGLVTSAGSKTLGNYISSYNATVVEKIKAEGGQILE